jgi:hypothetical protein
MFSLRVLAPVTPLGAILVIAGCVDGIHQKVRMNPNCYYVPGTSPWRFNYVEHNSLWNE